MYILCFLFFFFFLIDVCIRQFMCEPNIYVYIICLLMDKFVPLLFVFQLNSFSTGQKYLLQRSSLSVAIK